MDEGMQTMTTLLVAIVALATTITVSVSVTNLTWGRVATECVSSGGSWGRQVLAGSPPGDWACTRLTPTSH